MVSGLDYNIMVVDDEEGIRKLMKIILLDFGYTNVILASDGQEAVDKFREIHKSGGLVDVIITDISMPRLNGIESTIEIKKMKPEIPVIACTGHRNRYDLTKAGFIEILDKPCSCTDIIEKIREYCPID